MNSVKFEGRSAEMKKNTPWLAAEDIDGLGDVKVTISEVYRHKDVEFEAGRREEFIYSIAFEKANKQLVLNATNRKTLVSKFGANVKDWAGKSVVLFVQEGIRLGKSTVKGIRIK